MPSTGIITIWRFEKAPAKYRALHQSVFAAEWVAHVPAGSVAEEFEDFVDGSSSACLERRTLKDGGLVYFGSNSDTMVMAATRTSTAVAEPGR
jgi:hypothetical protein